jgi:hypothetical protein
MDYTRRLLLREVVDAMNEEVEDYVRQHPEDKDAAVLMKKIWDLQCTFVEWEDHRC